ncbi:hypothetical protein [Shewanella sp. GXUN23E]|uniref:hypothetical protein n=1 Tax=Shewanella sp. GXUN23E TaxID=3422498 RepID=UPI003D7D5F20
MKTRLYTLALCGLSLPALADPANVQNQFFDNLSALCGQAFEGRVTAGNEADSNFSSQRLVMHIRECNDMQLKIPFHVGEDRSRTWVITRTDTGLLLKHDHRHQDGSEDKVSMYGGHTAAAGTANEQSFPVDEFSIDNFKQNGLGQSVTNVWHLYLYPASFSYRLTRENRDFRVDFDLSKPVALPPAPWGDE